MPAADTSTSSSSSSTITVTDQIRDDILSDRLRPGDRLFEVPLSERYNCGRAAVRAALLELTTEGLVEREANRGATVRRTTVAEAIQITQARSALERLVAAEAARNASREDRAELQTIIQEMTAAVADERGRDYSALNARLHRRLSEMSGHEIAAQLIANLRNRAAHHRYRLAVMPGRSEESLPQHCAIVEAVTSGDPEAAAGAMAAHLDSVVDVLRRWGDA